MEPLTPRPRDAAVFWISVLLLFLELLVIRWVSVEVRIFAHLKNLVLISAFLGAGLGSYHAARPIRLWVSAAFLAATVVLVSNPLRLEVLSMQRITQDLSPLSAYLFYEVKGQFAWTPTLIGLGWTFVLFGLIAAIFYPIGQLLGGLFDAHPRPLRAYAVNLAGSLLGILLFVAVSAFSLPPVVWFGAAAALHLGLALGRPRAEWVAVPLLAVVLACVAFPRDPGRTVWSPYQKLTLLSGSEQGVTLATSRCTIRTNNTGYQGMLDLSDASGLPARDRARSQYNFPYRLLAPDPEDVLIVGAGSGNDAAGALRNGARWIDAVEIDPVILAMGKELHPEQPYANPRVHPVVDDARSFFKKTTRRYDLVWFGLADSVTLSSTHNNVRLDHYLYTVESLTEVASLLKPGGVIVMTYSVTTDFIADRLKGLFNEVFGQPPIGFIFPQSDLGWSGVCFVGGPEASMREVRARIAAQPWVGSWIADHAAPPYPMETPLTTDDWPYLFHPVAGIPAVHLVVTGILLALLVCGKRALLGRGAIDLRFFCLGGGFLLLEVQNISKAALLFGATWEVNAVIISAILLMAFFATLAVARFRPGARGLAGAWTLLLATLLANYFLPLGLLNRLQGSGKVLLASAFLTSPMFFAGIIFSTAFAAAPSKAAALGANLLGAIVGGMLESLSFVLGVRALLLVAGFFYLAAWVSDRGSRPAAA